MASIATRTGDDGTTSLLYGQRVAKHHPQIEAVGACDELNVALGAVRLVLPGEAAARPLLDHLQQNLVALMGEIACAEEDAARYDAGRFARLAETDLARIDAAIAEIEARLPAFSGWATPGANAPALAWDHARVVARRAERVLSGLREKGRDLRPVVGRFLNRLSDYCWLAARDCEPGRT